MHRSGAESRPVSVQGVPSLDLLPRTFLEWGVSVPFTTALLASARIRPGRRGRPEMIMANPSGGRGLYVFDLAAAPDVASLTLHDRLLLERLLALPAVTPSAIRDAARAVALEGAAGRKAARGAVRAAEDDAAMRLLMQFHLVTRLLEENGLERVDWTSLSGDDRELRAHIRGLLDRVAPQLGIPVEGLFAQIEAIADLAMPIGTPMEGSKARNEVMLARLRTFTASLARWSVGESGPAALETQSFLEVAERTVREGAQAQDAARELLGRVTLLLRDWRQPAGERWRALLTRPEWLLDGWSQVCGQWEAVARDERAAQRQLLQQMLAALPMLDPQRRAGTVAPEAAAIRFDRGRRVKLHEDWRTGLAVVDGRVRAELIRAATA